MVLICSVLRSVRVGTVVKIKDRETLPVLTEVKGMTETRNWAGRRARRILSENSRERPLATPESAETLHMLPAVEYFHVCTLTSTCLHRAHKNS